MTILCLSPISIKNPNFGLDLSVDVRRLKDCTSSYIQVPCGHCSQCIANRQFNYIQRIQMESLHNYIFFCTLTYNMEMLPTVLTSTGYEIPFADIRDVQNMFKRLRKYDLMTRPFKYFYVSELGKKRGRPHFHILFFLPKYDTDNEYTSLNLERKLYDVVLSQWKRKVSSSDKKPIYKPLCTFQEIWKHGKRYSNYDFHFVKPLFSEDSFSNVSFYVLKYMLKPSSREVRLQQALRLNLSEDEYNSVWSLVRSRCIASKGFGLSLSPFGDPSDDILNHIKKGISLSEDFPKFFNPVTGQSFPLSRFYRCRPEFLDVSDLWRFYGFNHRDSNSSLDSPIITVPKTLDEVLKEFHRFEKISDSVSERGDFDSVSDEFD